MNIELLGLKAKICGYQHVSFKLRNRINRLRGPRRHELRLDKRFLGEHTREHLIAYGLLRDVPYSSIEARCAKGNEPDPQVILNIIHEHVKPWQRREWTLERVKGALLGKGVAR